MDELNNTPPIQKKQATWFFWIPLCLFWLFSILNLSGVLNYVWVSNPLDKMEHKHDLFFIHLIIISYGFVVYNLFLVLIDVINIFRKARGLKAVPGHFIATIVLVVTSIIFSAGFVAWIISTVNGLVENKAINEENLKTVFLVNKFLSLAMFGIFLIIDTLILRGIKRIGSKKTNAISKFNSDKIIATDSIWFIDAPGVIGVLLIVLIVLFLEMNSSANDSLALEGFSAGAIALHIAFTQFNYAAIKTRELKKEFRRKRPPGIRKGHLFDPTGLAIKLRNATDPISKYLYSQCPPEIQKQLEGYDSSNPLPESLKNGLVSWLNQLSKRSDLFDIQQLQHLSLTEENRIVIEREARNENRNQFNWLVLSEAYPQEITNRKITKSRRNKNQ